jgi:hypothetical protein
MNHRSKQSIILFDWQAQRATARWFRGGCRRNRFDQGYPKETRRTVRLQWFHFHLGLTSNWGGLEHDSNVWRGGWVDVFTHPQAPSLEKQCWNRNWRELNLLRRFQHTAEANNPNDLTFRLLHWKCTNFFGALCRQRKVKSFKEKPKPMDRHDCWKPLVANKISDQSVQNTLFLDC